MNLKFWKEKALLPWFYYEIANRIIWRMNSLQILLHQIIISFLWNFNSTDLLIGQFTLLSEKLFFPGLSSSQGLPKAQDKVRKVFSLLRQRPLDWNQFLSHCSSWVNHLYLLPISTHSLLLPPLLAAHRLTHLLACLLTQQPTHPTYSLVSFACKAIAHCELIWA